MGSLMAGWGSRFSDPESVKLQRNRSLTKEEIDAYWRSKRQKEEEHLRDISGSLSPTKMASDEEKTFGRSRSGPLPSTKDRFLEGDDDSETNLEKLIQTHGWYEESNFFHSNHTFYRPEIN
nr:Tat-binding like [Ipomoea batatas]